MSKDITDKDINWKPLQTLVLARMDVKMKGLSKADLEKPTIHITDPETMEPIELSMEEMQREVKLLSDIGKKYIAAQIMLINKLQPT